MKNNDFAEVQRFTTPVEVAEVLEMYVLDIPQSEWEKCYVNWFKCLQKFVGHHEEYFKKQ